MQNSATSSLRGFWQVLAREFSWIPTWPSLAALVLLIAVMFVWKGGWIYAPFALLARNPAGPFQFDLVDWVRSYLLITGSLAALLVFPFIGRVDARRGKPASAFIGLCVCALFPVLLIMKTYLPVYAFGMLEKLNSPEMSVEITPELAWEELQEDPDMTRKDYLTVCQYIVDRAYFHDLPPTLCIDPAKPDSRLNLKPSDSAVEERAIRANTNRAFEVARHIFHLSWISVLLTWLAYFLLVRRDWKRGEFDWRKSAEKKP